MKIYFYVSLYILLHIHVSLAAINNTCVDCTAAAGVWCPQIRTCVSDENDCPTLPSSGISWFINSGTCTFAPISSPDACPDWSVEFDARLPPGSVLTGNQIMVPIQPRIVVNDTLANQTYDVGGFFTFIPRKSEQTPQFFFFSKAVDRFVATLQYRPYSYVEVDPEDEYYTNSSQVIQLLDMTVVGNSNLEYNISFVVSRKNNITGLNTCAFTPSLVFQQTPTYADFQFTLGAVGIVVWLLGTFALLNFMLYFNSREEAEQKRSISLSAAKTNSPQLSSRSAVNYDVTVVEKKKPFKQKLKRYGSLMKEEGKKFIRSCSMSDKEFLTEYGVTLYHYIWFHRMALIYIAICATVACAIGLPTDLIFGANRDLIAGDFATSTIASVSLDSAANLVHFFIVIINVSLSVGFVWRLRKFSFAVVVAGEQEALPAQEFAVEIKGFPKHILDEKMLRAHFADVYGEDQIVSAHVSLVYGKKWWGLEELRQEKEKCEKELAETNVRPQIFEHFWHLYDVNKKVDAINYWEDQVNKYRAKKTLPDPDHGAGYAFVTFAERDMVRHCLKNNNHSRRWYWFRKVMGMITSKEVSRRRNPHFTALHSEALEVHRWKIRPAPLPNEIIWPNLENSVRKKKLLQFFGLLLEMVVLACVLSVTLGFALLEVARDLYLTNVYYQFGGATILEAIASLTIVILPEAVAIIEEVVAPVVETVEDQAGHVHKSGWRKTVMWHTAFFELMSGLVISRMIYFLIGVAVLYDSQAPFNSYHYLFNKTGMDMMKYMCIKTFTVYGIKYPALCLIKLVQSRLSGKLERPDFDYFDLYAQKIIVMFCVLVYGSVMPLILPLGLMYLGLSFLYDRWAIVNFHRKDVTHDAKLLFYAADICSFYFAIAPLATLVIITKLFVHWPACAALLVIFSFIIGIIMIETRRWQYMNQNLKGVRRVIKASDHTFAKHMANTNLVGPGAGAPKSPGEEGREGEEEKGEIMIDKEESKAKKKWKALKDHTNVKKTKGMLLGVVKGMKEGVLQTSLDDVKRTEAEVLRAAYKHPLSINK